MSTARRLASALLGAVTRRSSTGSRDWANAMLRELDFIESDWAALLWALGSTTAIFRHSVPRGLRASFGKLSGHEEGLMMNNVGKKAVGMISGAVIAAAAVVGAFGLVQLSLRFFPAWDLERVQWAEFLAVIVLPETIFIVAAVALWRKRRSMAVGILLSAVTLVTHFILHFTNHH